MIECKEINDYLEYAENNTKKINKLRKLLIENIVKPTLKRDDVFFDEETYYKFYHWLEDKLRNITLYNLIDSDMDEQYISSLVDTYKNMRDIPVDFDTEFVVFQHDR